MTFDETELLGGKVVILHNDHMIWQFRMWIANKKKYVRKSLRIKDKYVAVELAKNKFYEIGYCH